MLSRLRFDGSNRVNTVAVLAAAVIAFLPVLGLAAMAWFAIANEAATVHSFDGPDGLQYDE